MDSSPKVCVHLHTSEITGKQPRIATHVRTLHLSIAWLFGSRYNVITLDFKSYVLVRRGYGPHAVPLIEIESRSSSGDFRAKAGILECMLFDTVQVDYW